MPTAPVVQAGTVKMPLYRTKYTAFLLNIIFNYIFNIITVHAPLRGVHFFYIFAAIFTFLISEVDKDCKYLSFYIGNE